MELLIKPMGTYQTNCYIIKTDCGEIIIDPGIDATSWVKQNVQNPLAILNTHGHFDHVWSNGELKKDLNIPIYCPRDDAFFLKIEDMFGMKVPVSEADFEVLPDESVTIGNSNVKFWHFAGHTPGCSMIEIDSTYFSGDFIFKSSIGRTDFPYSNPQDMAKSLLKFKNFTDDFTIYPGHGHQTTVFEEQKHIGYWLSTL